MDFSKVLPSPTFLDETIGRLIGQFTKAAIVEKLKLTGLSPEAKKTLNGIVVNRYYALANAEKFKNRPKPVLILRKPRSA